LLAILGEQMRGLRLRALDDPLHLFLDEPSGLRCLIAATGRC
jgi:hypothetical protein